MISFHIVAILIAGGEQFFDGDLDSCLEWIRGLDWTVVSNVQVIPQ